MKAYGGVDVWIHVFFISTMVRGEWSASRLGSFTTGGNRSRYPLDRKLDVPQNAMDKLQFLTPPRIDLLALGGPVRDQSLYRPRYRGTSSTWGYDGIWNITSIDVAS
jgi:hypothetical protein